MVLGRANCFETAKHSQPQVHYKHFYSLTRHYMSTIGSSAGQFKFMPRFKAQTEGSVVYYSHTVVLESVLLRGRFMHASETPYSWTPDAADASLPKCLQVRSTPESCSNEESGNR